MKEIVLNIFEENLIGEESKRKNLFNGFYQTKKILLRLRMIFMNYLVKALILQE